MLEMAMLLLNKRLTSFWKFEVTASRTSRSMEEITSRITYLRAFIVSGLALKTLSLAHPQRK